MYITLVNLGLIASAFMILPGADIREIKLITAFVFALALGLLMFYRGGFMPFRNKWFLIFMMYLPISTYMAPHPNIKMLGMNVGRFWVWEPLVIGIVVMLAVISIASYQFTPRKITYVLHTISWSGVLMGLYVLLQAVHIDQIFVHLTKYYGGHVAGFTGNPTLVSPFIAMTIPVSFYLKKYLFAIISICAVFATMSQVAIVGMLAGMLLFVGSRTLSRAIIVVVFCITTCAGLVWGYNNVPEIKKLVEHHERFDHWKRIAKDLNSPIMNDSKKAFPLTGVGIGSFKYVYHVQHKNSFHQAHNDYLEIAYNTGIVGITLFLLGLFTMIRMNLSFGAILRGKTDRYKMMLLSSFACIAVCAAGTFVWQIGTTIFLTVVIVGLLHNKNTMSIEGGTL